MFNGVDMNASEDEIYAFAKKITISDKKYKHDFNDVVHFIKKHSKKESEIRRATFSSLFSEVIKIVEKIRSFRLPI